MPADSDTACTGEIHIIGEIGRIVTEVIGDDYLMDTEISASTSFAHDLELESVEFVSVASRLQGLYGEKVDFVPFRQRNARYWCGGLRARPAGQYVGVLLHPGEPCGGGRVRRGPV